MMNENQKAAMDLHFKVLQASTAPISVSDTPDILETADSILTNPANPRSRTIEQPRRGELMLKLLEAVARRLPVRTQQRRADSRNYTRDSAPAVDVGRYLPPDADARQAVLALQTPVVNRQKDDSAWSHWVRLLNHSRSLRDGASVREMDTQVIEQCLGNLVRNQL
jgi:hypothetical protein